MTAALQHCRLHAGRHNELGGPGVRWGDVPNITAACWSRLQAGHSYTSWGPLASVYRDTGRGTCVMIVS